MPNPLMRTSATDGNIEISSADEWRDKVLERPHRAVGGETGDNRYAWADLQSTGPPKLCPLIL